MTIEIFTWGAIALCFIGQALAIAAALEMRRTRNRVLRLAKNTAGRVEFVAAQVRRLRETRGDARAEINRASLRVAKLEELAGIAPPSVHADMKKVRPIDWEEDDRADAQAAADELEAISRKTVKP